MSDLTSSVLDGNYFDTSMFSFMTTNPDVGIPSAVAPQSGPYDNSTSGQVSQSVADSGSQDRMGDFVEARGYNDPGYTDTEEFKQKEMLANEEAYMSTLRDVGLPQEKASFLESLLSDKDTKSLLVKGGLLGVSGLMQGMMASSSAEKQIAAAKEMLDTKNQQAIDAENRLAKRAAYGKVAKENFGFKDTGLLGALAKEKK